MAQPDRTTIAHATVDADGRLTAADPTLSTLNARAGGDVGIPLAVPQLATIAHLARRLGIVVSRPVVLAGEEGDLDVWVRAQPTDDGVRLAVTGWREKQGWGFSAPAEEDEADLASGHHDWDWRCDQALRLTYFTARGSIGSPHFDATPYLGVPIERLFGSDELDALFARREPFRKREAVLPGVAQPVLLSAVVARDAEGRFAGYAGVASLVEAPVPTLVEVPLATDFTQGLDRALRRPLVRIIANADSINAAAEGPIAERYTAYAADIAHAGRHLLELMDDLADMQAVERADFSLPLEPVDLTDLCLRAAGLFAVRAANLGVTIAPPQAGQPMIAAGDVRRVQQILVNLLGNALRYAPRGSVVSITPSAANGRVGVAVADAGKGIAPEDAERVFGKFERVDTSEAGGTGLGLYISRRLARAMGGDLTLQSAPGEGARFTLTLNAG